jgi:hypothetical protein
MPDLAPSFLVNAEAMINALVAGMQQFGKDADARAAALEAGTVPIHRPPLPLAPEPAPVFADVQAPSRYAGERMQIFTLEHIKWSEAGQTVLASKHSWASPPRAVAEIACRHSLADLPGSDRAARLIAAHGVANSATASDLCVDLDQLNGLVDSPVEGLPRSVPRFIEKIGPTRTGVINVHHA